MLLRTPSPALMRWDILLQVMVSIPTADIFAVLLSQITQHKRTTEFLV